MTREEQVTELERLLHSGLVREGSQGYVLLEHLGKRAIDGPSEGLKEYTIGVEALGKPADYDPRLDPSVRVEIGRLRTRLKQHYAEEASGRMIRLEIPRGGYAAKFVPAVSRASAPAPGAWVVRRNVLLALAGSLVVLASILVLVRELSRPSIPPVLARFWAPYLDRDLPTLLVYGAPLFYKVDGSFFRDPHVNSPAEFDESPVLKRLTEALRPVERRPVFHFTGFGETEAVFRITRLISGAGTEVLLRRSNDVSWEELKLSHTILVGGVKFNRQIAGLPFRFKYESVPRRIVNRQPVAGETAEYVTRSVTPHGPITEEYALISAYPGLAPNTRLMVLDSSSSEGAGLAAEYITREDTVREMCQSIDCGTSKPFQIVVRGRFRDGILVVASCVAHALL